MANGERDGVRGGQMHEQNFSRPSPKRDRGSHLVPLPAAAGRGHVPRRQAYCGNHWSGNAAPSPRVIYTRRKARRWLRRTCMPVPKQRVVEDELEEEEKSKRDSDEARKRTLERSLEQGLEDT